MRITAGGLARVLGGAAFSVVAFGASSFAQVSQPTASASTTAITAPAANPITALKSIGPASATGKTVSLAKGAQGIFLIGPNGHTLSASSSPIGQPSPFSRPVGRGPFHDVTPVPHDAP
jgi:hypothetical protein